MPVYYKMKYLYILLGYLFYIMNRIVSNLHRLSSPIQHINNRRTGRWFTNLEKEAFLQHHDVFNNKKIITISPAGFKGIYVLGICKYLKETFDLSNYIFAGASAGAWNALMMCYKKDTLFIKEQVLDSSLQQSKTIQELERAIQQKLLQYTSTEDYDLDRLSIGVTTVDQCKTNTTIYLNFMDLKDAIDCCIASSHIPLITGGMFHKYNNLYTFDGGFSKYPYLNIYSSLLHITPSFLEEKKHKPSIFMNINDHTSLFSKDRFNFTELYQSGYNDAKQNHVYLSYLLGEPEEL